MISVQNKPVKTINNFWNNIHFHPTDAIEDEWGQKILNQIADDGTAETVRIYAMMEDIVSMSEDGDLQYDFTQNDIRIEYMLKKGFNLLISYNFIPPCIAENKEICSGLRYKNKKIITSKLRDYKKWEEICYVYTQHLIEKYGEKCVSNWYLQCYNEPDSHSFLMQNLDWSTESVIKRMYEYRKMYASFAAGVIKASSRLKVGGPAIAFSTDFLDGFLKYIKEEKIRLDYVSIHTYGSGLPALTRGDKYLNEENTLNAFKEHEEIIKKYFPMGKEIVVDEWGAVDSGGAVIECNHRLTFREDSNYAAYTGKMIAAYIRDNAQVSRMMICLSGQNYREKDFSGRRSFFTHNFIKKPVYNAFILASKLKSKLLESKNDDVHISVIPTADDEGNLSIMLAYASKNYIGELPDIKETVLITDIYGEKNVKIYCIDENNTNPYKYFLKHGMSEPLNSEEIEMLRKIGDLNPVSDYQVAAEGAIEIKVAFTNNALVLIEVE